MISPSLEYAVVRQWLRDLWRVARPGSLSVKWWFTVPSWREPSSQSLVSFFFNWEFTYLKPTWHKSDERNTPPNTPSQQPQSATLTASTINLPYGSVNDVGRDQVNQINLNLIVPSTNGDFAAFSESIITQLAGLKLFQNPPLWMCKLYIYIYCIPYTVPLRPLVHGVWPVTRQTPKFIGSSVGASRDGKFWSSWQLVHRHTTSKNLLSVTSESATRHWDLALSPRHCNFN
jgi:hypothetical protein